MPGGMRGRRGGQMMANRLALSVALLVAATAAAGRGASAARAEGVSLRLDSDSKSADHQAHCASTNSSSDTRTYKTGGSLSVTSTYIDLSSNVTVIGHCGGGSDALRYESELVGENAAAGVFRNVRLDARGYGADKAGPDGVKWDVTGSGELASYPGPVRVEGNATFDIFNTAEPITIAAKLDAQIGEGNLPELSVVMATAKYTYPCSGPVSMTGMVGINLHNFHMRAGGGSSEPVTATVFCGARRANASEDLRRFSILGGSDAPTAATVNGRPLTLSSYRLMLEGADDVGAPSNTDASDALPFPDLSEVRIAGHLVARVAGAAVNESTLTVRFEKRAHEAVFDVSSERGNEANFEDRKSVV